MINIDNLEKLSINNSNEFIPIIDRDRYPTEKSYRMILAPENISDLFTIDEVTSLTIYESDGETIVDSLTRYSSIQDIHINKSVYRDEDLNPITAATVVFKQEDIEATVKKIEQEVFPVIDFNKMNEDEFNQYITKNLGKECSNIIFAGTDVELGNGTTEHFSFSENDQRNIASLASIAMSDAATEISGGEFSLPYHSDKSQCKLYSYKDIIRIYAAMEGYILYHTTYCNALNTYVRSLTSRSEKRAVTYGQEIPDETIANQMNETILHGQAVIQTILSKYDLVDNEVTESLEGYTEDYDA